MSFISKAFSFITSIVAFACWSCCSCRSDTLFWSSKHKRQWGSDSCSPWGHFCISVHECQLAEHRYDLHMIGRSPFRGHLVCLWRLIFVLLNFKSSVICEESSESSQIKLIQLEPSLTTTCGIYLLMCFANRLPVWQVDFN